jgi:predicted AlkP superfamily phosphohydrolase/phosphomutase
MSTNLLVLGIDAANPTLLRRWADEGKLPAIRALIDRGISGLVRGIKGFFIGSTWPSFYTGLNPAGHGFYRIDQLRSGTYDFFRPLDAPNGIGGIPFWKIASDAGRQVAVLDVPLSRLDPDLNGLQIVEWGSHDAVFGFQASSPEVARDLMVKVGAYPMPTDCDRERKTVAEFEEFVKGLEQAAAKKADLTIDVLGRRAWDMLIQVFTESHCVGHQCWHIHDPSHPAHDPQLLEGLGDPLERVYMAIDRAVAAILAKAGSNHVLLVSAHGMSHYRGAQFLLSEILFRLGVTARPSIKPPGSSSGGGRLVAVARRGWGWLPEGVRAAIRPPRSIFAGQHPDQALSHLGVDVYRSRCFAIPNGFPVGGIRLNISGREPYGILSPGREAEVFCAELANDLRAIRDERTGRPLIAEVYRTDDLYSGARRDALPDLLIEWDSAEPIGTLAYANGRHATLRATSSKIGIVEGSNAWGRTGEHIPVGTFVFAGPHVLDCKISEPVSVMDFHPSICKLMGLAAPDVDGKVIDRLIAAA